MGTRDRLRKEKVIAGEIPGHRVKTVFSPLFRCPKCGEALTAYQVTDHRCFESAVCSKCGEKAEEWVLSRNKHEEIVGQPMCAECARKQHEVPM